MKVDINDTRHQEATMRRDFTQCPLCGNHTVRAYNHMCSCCDTIVALPPFNRLVLERAIIALGLMFAVAFVLVILTGHVRAQSGGVLPVITAAALKAPS
jgi:hypothetical protein